MLLEIVTGGFLLGVMGTCALGAMSYNRLQALDERCQTAFSDIDIQLKHRHSLLPALVETVRGYMKHELSVMEAVTSARGKALAAEGADNVIEAEKRLSASVRKLIQVTEKYPEIKADNHFRDLRMEISDAENKITAARRFYNLAVQEYNTTLRQFPGSLIGRQRGLSRRSNFDIGIERELLDEPAAIKF
jgi:LemA protein